MCNAYNHPPGCTCGWGGEGHLGRREESGYGHPAIETIKHYCFEFSSFVNPNATCPVCGEPVYYYESPYGGKVYFDSLGPPWPKHPCIDYVTTGARQEKVHYKEWHEDSWQPFRVRGVEIVDSKYLMVTGRLLPEWKEIVCYIENSNNVVEKLNRNLSQLKIDAGDQVTISTFEIVKTEKSVNVKEFQLTGTIQQSSEEEMIYATIKPIGEYVVALQNGSYDGLAVRYEHKPLILAWIMIATPYGFDYEGFKEAPERAVMLPTESERIVEETLKCKLHGTPIEEWLKVITPMEFFHVVDKATDAELKALPVVKELFKGNHRTLKFTVAVRAAEWAMNYKGLIKREENTYQVMFGNANNVPKELIEVNKSYKEVLRNG